MALGKRADEQQELWIATTDLPKSPRHPFHRQLNRMLAQDDFDRFVESICEPYYADGLGRPGIAPGIYFRMLLTGYFEGIGSQRGIAWRCSDSRSLQTFLGLEPTAATLEANAAIKSIVRQDTGEDWKAYVKRLAEEAGRQQSLLATGGNPGYHVGPTLLPAWLGCGWSFRYDSGLALTGQAHVQERSLT
jgi:transposase